MTKTYKLFLNLFSFLLLTITLFGFYNIFSIQTKAQSSQSSQSKNGARNISEQAADIQNKRQDIDSLKNEVSNLQSEIEQINEEISALQVEEARIQTKIDELRSSNADIENQLKNNGISLSNTQNQSEREALEEVKRNLDDKLVKNAEDTIAENQLLIETKDKIVEKNSDLQAKQTELSNKQKQLEELDTTIEEEVDRLQTSVLDESTEWVYYLALLIGYWIVYRVVLFLIKKSSLSPSPQSSISFLAKIIWITVSILTLLYILAGRLELVQQIFAVVAFISLAISLAIKDSIANLFGSILIKTSKKYTVGSVIRFDNQGQKAIGEVIKIDFFGTTLAALTEDYYPTGEIIYIPNNQFVIQVFSNLTLYNRYLWIHFDLVVKNGTDLKKAKTKIKKVLDRKIYKPGKIKSVNSRYSLAFLPKVFLSTSHQGPTFTIHLPVKIGKYSETVEKFVNNIYSLNSDELEIVSFLEK